KPATSSDKMDTAAPRATQYSGLMSLMTFLMISMLPIHLRASAAWHAFRGGVLHAGQKHRRQKLKAVETIMFVHRCPTALWSYSQVVTCRDVELASERWERP